ncbi:MAG: carboxymuconolactone decarboxylase family protein [Hyphomicrobiales bacterium]|nr:carboxymuconolactone decarboxylase family protein [Hyphomicrobiales bacterium]
MTDMDLLPETPDDPKLKAMFDEVTARWPRVPNLYRMLGHSPDMLRGWLDLAWSLRLNATTPRRTRELMILRGARMTETAYEWAHHVPMALEAGVTQAEVDALMEGDVAETFTEAERAALQLATEVTSGPAASPSCMANLRQHYCDAEIVELVLTASFYVCVGRTLKSLNVPLEEGYEASW